MLYADIAVVSASTVDDMEERGADGHARAYSALLALNLVLNASWSWLFFNRRLLGTSAIAAAALTASSADLTRRSVAERGPSAAPLALYPLWCAFATRAVVADLVAQPPERLMADTETTDETEHEEERQRLADRVLGAVEDAVYWAIAIVLIAGSVALLVSQFNTMLRLRNTPASTTMLEILDGLLLIFIFVELLYAVRACLRSHEIVAEPFLIVGILAGIKEIVVLSVEAATLLAKGPEFSRAIVEIGVLGGVVLVLALSAFVLRVRRREGPDREQLERT